MVFHDTVEPISSSEDALNFFPSVSTLSDLGGDDDVDDTGSQFFDAFPSSSALSIYSMGLDFYDCPCIAFDATLFTDWMGLQIFNDTTYLDCSLDAST